MSTCDREHNLFNSKISLLLAIITLSNLDTTTAQIPRDCLEPYCACVNTTSLICHNFTRFEQLDFRRVNSILFESVELRPYNVRLDLNENLNFNGLKLNGRLTLSNLRSLSAFYNPFRQILYNDFSLAILDSSFSFVGGSTGNLAAETSILSMCNFQSSAQNFNYIFSNLRIIEFTLSGILFERTVCPILFRNTQIFNFLVINPFGAFGFDNLTGLFSDDAATILNTNIRQIDLDYTRATNPLQPQWLDTWSIMNPAFFARLDRININSARKLAYIQEDTFKNLKNVRKLEFNSVNIKELLTRNRRWLKHLNYNMPVYDIDNLKLNASMASSIFQLIVLIDDNWQFNEERDICLFRNFPHDKLVFPFLLFSQPTLPCTCTIYWLYKYFSKYQAIYNLNQNSIPFHCFQQSNWDTCRFEALFNKWCPNTDADPDEDFTTLRPNAGIFATSTSLTTFISGQTTQMPTNSPNTQTTSTQTTNTASTTSQITSSTYTTVLSSASPIGQDGVNPDLSVAAFYMAIVLCVVTLFIIIAVIILYCKVCRSRPNSSAESTTSSQDIYI